MLSEQLPAMGHRLQRVKCKVTVGKPLPFHLAWWRGRGEFIDETVKLLLRRPRFSITRDSDLTGHPFDRDADQQLDHCSLLLNVAAETL